MLSLHPRVAWQNASTNDRLIERWPLIAQDAGSDLHLLHWGKTSAPVSEVFTPAATVQREKS